MNANKPKYHLLLISYACGCWRGYNIKHRSEQRTIEQRVDIDCPMCREAKHARA